MHTKEIDGVIFNYNSDLSGDVHINDGKQEAHVPGPALVQFVDDWRAENSEPLSRDKPMAELTTAECDGLVGRITAGVNDLAKQYLDGRKKLAAARAVIEEGVRLYETYALVAQPADKADPMAAGRWVNSCREFLRDEPPDPVETARRLGPIIAAHDFKRIADVLGLPKSDNTTIDQMVERIRSLRAAAGF